MRRAADGGRPAPEALGIRRRLSAVALAAASLVCLAYPAGASAHAFLLRSTPLDGATVETAPSAVRFVFSDAVRPAGGIEAVRNGGGSVLGGRRPFTTEEGHVLVVPLRKPLQHGSYTVRWRATSEDGHTIAGVIVFSFGAGHRVAAPSLSAGGTGPYASAVAGRWLFLFGALAALGIAAFRIVVWRPACARTGIDDRRPKALLVLLTAAFGLAAAGAVWLFEGSGVSGTRFAHLYEAGFGLALAGVALSLLPRRGLPGMRLATLLVAIALVLVPSFAGHALDADQPRVLSALFDAVHAGAAGLWLGGLLALGLVLASGPPETRGAAGRRFSALALGAVAALAATGILRAVYELSAVDQLWTTGYGRALLVKSGLLVTLVGIGFRNRTRLLPRGDLRRLRQAVAVEALLLAGLVVAIAFLTDLPPARELARAASVKQPALSSCDQWLEHFVVLAACNPKAKASIEMSDAGGRLFQHVPDFGLSTLSGDPVAPGDRVVLTGTAPEGTHLSALFVTRGTRAALARFGELGLERGGRAILTVTGSPLQPTFELRRPDGSVEQAPSLVLVRDRRQVGELAVRRRGRTVVATFRAPGTVAEVSLISEEAAEELLAEGELEGQLLSARTLRTRVGRRVTVELPLHKDARYVYVLPLARTITVGPALAPIPR